jgi:hypothetical protein
VPEPVEGHFSFLQVIFPKRFEQSVQNEKADEKPAIKNNISNYMNFVKYGKFKFKSSQGIGEKPQQSS